MLYINISELVLHDIIRGVLGGIVEILEIFELELR